MACALVLNEGLSFNGPLTRYVKLSMRMRRKCRDVFLATAGKRSRHASRHVRDARAVMHAGIANLRFPLKSAGWENVPGIPGACTTRNLTYLARGPLNSMQCGLHFGPDEESTITTNPQIDCLVQDCSISCTLAMEILQSALNHRNNLSCLSRRKSSVCFEKCFLWHSLKPDYKLRIQITFLKKV